MNKTTRSLLMLLVLFLIPASALAQSKADEEFEETLKINHANIVVANYGENSNPNIPLEIDTQVGVIIRQGYNEFSLKGRNTLYAQVTSEPLTMQVVVLDEGRERNTTRTTPHKRTVGYRISTKITDTNGQLIGNFTKVYSMAEINDGTAYGEVAGGIVGTGRKYVRSLIVAYRAESAATKPPSTKKGKRRG